MYRSKEKGLYTEVTFSPPELETTLTNEPSGYQDEDGNDIPLPSSTAWSDTVRPDAVYAKNPNKPLTRDNVARVYEAKFTYEDGRKDKLTPNQKKWLFEIAGHDNTKILDEKECGPCDDTLPELEEDEWNEGNDRLVALAAAALVVGALLCPLVTGIVAVEAGTDAAAVPEVVADLSELVADEPLRIGDYFGSAETVTPTDEEAIREWIESLHYDEENAVPPSLYVPHP